MKTFCPNCEKETDATFVCEVYECKECGEDCENYEKPSAAALTAEISRLQTGVAGMAQEIVNRAVDNERLFDRAEAAEAYIKRLEQNIPENNLALAQANLRAEAFQEALEHISDGDEYTSWEIPARIARTALAGGKTSNPDVSTTRDVLIDIKTAPDNNPDYNNRD